MAVAAHELTCTSCAKDMLERCRHPGFSSYKHVEGNATRRVQARDAHIGASPWVRAHPSWQVHTEGAGHCRAGVRTSIACSSTVARKGGLVVLRQVRSASRKEARSLRSTGKQGSKDFNANGAERAAGGPAS